ncbi:hypothetical protein ACFWXK_01860 [Streptomyces sp. NPDC059070]|uniref:hypothetical protein n=1 Tax=unclassified Streptomyces TaxID=2593676 RepID=UPI0034E1C27D
MIRMESRRGVLAGALVSATALLVTLAPSAVADGTPWNGRDLQIATALKHHAEGTQNQADINLIRSIPELAASVPDPTQPEEVTIKEAIFTGSGQAVSPANGEPLSSAELADIMPPSTAQPSAPGEAVEGPEETEVDKEPGSGLVGATGGTWKMTHVYHTHRSYLGSVIFKYHTYAEFNYGGGKVRAWGDRYDDFSNVQQVVKIDNRRLADRYSRVPASSGTSKMSRQIELCFTKYGCYATLHPYASVQVFGTGKTKIAGTGV